MGRDYHYSDRQFKGFGRFTAKQRREIIAKLVKRDGGMRCHYCRIPLVPNGTIKQRDFHILRTADFDVVTIDHKKSLARGGSNVLRNLVLACRRCNCGKCNKTYAYWLTLMRLRIFET